MQGIHAEILTAEADHTGQAAPSAAQLKHVLGLQKFGVGLSSQSQEGALLCTGNSRAWTLALYETGSLVCKCGCWTLQHDQKLSFREPCC